MKKLLWITLLLALSLTAVACVTTPDTSSDETTDEATDGGTTASSTEAPTETPTEALTEAPTEAPSEDPVDPKVQNALLISPEDFKNPANEFRALHIEHGYPSGSIEERVKQLKDLGFGGVATNDLFTPDYLRSEDSLARFNEILHSFDFAETFA